MNTASTWRTSYQRLAPAQAVYKLTGHRHRADFRLVLLVGLLLLLGLIVVYAISPALSYRLFSEYREQHFLYRQLLHVGLGISAFVAAAIIPLTKWRQATRIFLWAAIGANLLLLVPGLGITINGATRWLGLGPLSTFQPSELLKLALILLIADYGARLSDGEIRGDTAKIIKPALALLAVCGLLIVFLQRDMGTMLVIAAIITGMTYIAGVHLRVIMTILGAIAGAVVAAIVMFPYRLERLLTFLRPSDDIQGAAYHVNQSLIAIGSGGLFGLGLGRSLQVYGYVPEAANDSIFAIFAEKFGLVGSVILLIIFGLLLQRILSIAMRAPDTYTQLLVSGVFIWLTTHIVINVGAMLALLPLTGITLPFLSIGGSSLLVMMFGLGLVFQISRYAHFQVSTPVLPHMSRRLRRPGA